MANDNLLSFKNWVKQNPSVQFRDRKSSYESYVKSFTLDSIIDDTVVRDELKASYIAYLKRLVVFYEDDPEVQLLENMDFDDPIQLAGAIPIFARKLKDLALFTKNKRSELKNKKLEYSTKGSKLALETCLRNHIVDKFTGDERKEVEQNLEISCREKYNIN